MANSVKLVLDADADGIAVYAVDGRGGRSMEGRALVAGANELTGDARAAALAAQKRRGGAAVFVVAVYEGGAAVREIAADEEGVWHVEGTPGGDSKRGKDFGAALARAARLAQAAGASDLSRMAAERERSARREAARREVKTALDGFFSSDTDTDG